MVHTHRIVECRELAYILFGDLRDLLEEAPNRETVRWLNAVLDALLETIPEEFELKSSDGYLSDVLESFPNWQGEVEQLEEDYYILMHSLKHLRYRLSQDMDFSIVAADISRELQIWMDSFRNHIQKEQRLVQMAVCLEVGGGD
ncbi:MAG: hypothetical protein KDA80_02070 [Planctomycetaceae bacterium]|nr:hypothetical protein [Planctomycetaceae bacterium]